MDTSSAIRAFDFPLQINPAEIEYLGVREAFTWGPQALWLLCGLIWIFYFLVRDIPVQLLSRRNAPGTLGLFWLDRRGVQVTAAHAAADGIVGVVISDGMKQSGPRPWQDMTLFIYAMFFALFGLVAFYRSHVRLAFFLDTQRQRQDRPALVPASQRIAQNRGR